MFERKREASKEVIEKVKWAEKAPLVSVIIPTLKHRVKLLERAIKSVENQTYPHIEIIVESGGENVQNARNIAVSKSKGKYIALMDDDDEWYAEKIEKQVAYMESNNECSLCITWGDDYKFGLYHLIKPKPYWKFNELIAGFNISCTSAFLCRRSSFDAVGGMDETLHDNHEYDLAIKLSCIGEIYCLQEALTIFNQSDDNWSDRFDLKIKGMMEFVGKWGFAFNLNRWFNTVVCFTLFTIGFLTPFLNPNPVHKVFNITKEKMERAGEESHPIL